MKKFLLIFFVIVIIALGSFGYAKFTNYNIYANSKTFYKSVIDKAIDLGSNGSNKISNSYFNTSVGKVITKSKMEYKYSDELKDKIRAKNQKSIDEYESYRGDSIFSDSYLDERINEIRSENEFKDVIEEQQIYYDKEKNLIYCKAVRDDEVLEEYLFDSLKDLMYYKNDSGEVEYKTPGYFDAYTAQEIMKNNVSDTILYNEILKSISKNLKDEVFIDEKDGNNKNLILKMDKTQTRDLIVDVMKDIYNNKDIRDLLHLENKTEEEIKEFLEKMEESLDEELKDIDLSLVINTTVKNKKILGISIKLDISSKDDFIKFDMSVKVNDDGVFGELLVGSNDSNLKINLDIKKDKISFVCKENDYGYSIIFDSKDGKTFDKTGHVELTAKNDDIVYNFILKTKDGKSFDNTSEIVFEIPEETRKLLNMEEELVCTIKSMDNKELLKSSDIAGIVKMNGKEETIITLKTKDNKGIKETSSIELEVRDIFVLSYEAKDKKNLKDSGNIAILAESKITDEKVEISIKSNDKKSIKETSSLTMEGKFNEYEYKMDLKSKNKKSLRDADSYMGTIDIKSKNPEMTMNIKLDGKNITYHIESKNELSAFSLYYYDIEDTYDSYTYYTIDGSYEALDSIDFDKLMDISNAKEAEKKSSYGLWPDYDF